MKEERTRRGEEREKKTKEKKDELSIREDEVEEEADEATDGGGESGWPDSKTMQVPVDCGVPLQARPAKTTINFDPRIGLGDLITRNVHNFISSIGISNFMGKKVSLGPSRENGPLQGINGLR
ncbi:Hypothetical protein NTJ_09440 [Nesidiocoris tenuis]|uniref:Uncharacterized protein n=1 Tax=Nesidiocoris tenuis TaxID=355587 RepID=A0ABN7AWT2_9HEMI|nr:Hypothetical protein NTJ_09440 [Nesidiocoris tenuis]